MIKSKGDGVRGKKGERRPTVFQLGGDLCILFLLTTRRPLSDKPTPSRWREQVAWGLGDSRKGLVSTFGWSRTTEDGRSRRKLVRATGLDEAEEFKV